MPIQNEFQANLNEWHCPKILDMKMIQSDCKHRFPIKVFVPEKCTFRSDIEGLYVVPSELVAGTHQVEIHIEPMKVDILIFGDVLLSSAKRNHPIRILAKVGDKTDLAIRPGQFLWEAPFNPPVETPTTTPTLSIRSSEENPIRQNSLSLSSSNEPQLKYPKRASIPMGGIWGEQFDSTPPMVAQTPTQTPVSESEKASPTISSPLNMGQKRKMNGPLVSPIFLAFQDQEPHSDKD